MTILSIGCIRWSWADTRNVSGAWKFTVLSCWNPPMHIWHAIITSATNGRFSNVVTVQKPSISLCSNIKLQKIVQKNGFHAFSFSNHQTPMFNQLNLWSAIIISASAALLFWPSSDLANSEQHSAVQNLPPTAMRFRSCESQDLTSFCLEPRLSKSFSNTSTSTWNRYAWRFTEKPRPMR